MTSYSVAGLSVAKYVTQSFWTNSLSPVNVWLVGVVEVLLPLSPPTGEERPGEESETEYMAWSRLTEPYMRRSEVLSGTRNERSEYGVWVSMRSYVSCSVPPDLDVSNHFKYGHV